MAIPLAIGTAIVAPQAVIVLYGKAFELAALTIRLMCPLILIKGFGDLFCYQLVYSTKNEKIILPASAFASITNIVANAVLIPLFLQNGAVVASVFSELVTNLIQFVYMKHKIRFKIDLKAIIKSLVSTLTMGVCVWFLVQMRLPNIVGLIVEVFSGIIIYILLNYFMKNELLFEFVQKLKIKFCKN